MVLTLYILPIIYSLVYSDREKKSGGFWTLPNQVPVMLAIFGLFLLPPKADAQTLSLDSCKSLALQNNYGVKSAASELRQSEEVKKSAFTNYFPKASAMVAAVKMDDYLVKGNIPEMNLPVYDGNPANLASPTQFTYFPGMSLNMLDYMNLADIMVAQPLYTGGRIINGNKLANLGYEISKEKQAMTNTEVLVKTEELYWSVITLNDKLKTLDSYIKLLDTLYRDVNVSLKAGLIQRTDLLKVQLKQNELQMNRLKLTNGIILSKKALCQHIGISYDSTLMLSSFPDDQLMPADQSISPDAVKGRNEYKILEKVITVEELQKKMIQGEYLPQVSVGAAGWYLDAMDKTDYNGLVFATVSIPITDWWGGSHKIKESRAKVESARYKLAETTELLALQVAQARNQMNENFFQISIARKSVEQAGENLKVTNDNYKAGISGMSDLLEAQSAYQDVMNNLTEAKCNYQIARAKYLQAVNTYK
jgi:outer membrane protein TolC